jgi:predicted O-methyltransferase YrrM
MPMLRLFKTDLAVLFLLGIAALGGCLLAFAIVPRAPWIPASVVVVLAISALMLELYRRLQAQFKEVAEIQDRATRCAFQQTEAILSVINTIAPVAPLPGTRTWAASPDILNHLCRTVLARQPEQVFEVGSGVSTLTIAYCLKRLGRGRIVSLESDARFAEATRQMLAEHKLDGIATVVHAPLTDTEIRGEHWQWYDTARMPEVPPIDLLFVDGPHGLTQPLARYPAIPMLLPRLAPRCVIVLDDGGRPDERAIAERWARELGSPAEYLFMEKGAYQFQRGKSGAGANGDAGSAH